MEKHLETLKRMGVYDDFVCEYKIQNMLPLENYVESFVKNKVEFRTFVSLAFDFDKSKYGKRYWQNIVAGVTLPDDLIIEDKFNKLHLETFKDCSFYLTISDKKNEAEHMDFKISKVQIEKLINKLTEIKNYL